MRTSKDDQIAVLEKATQNIKDDKWYRDGIQFYSRAECKYVDCMHDDRPFLFDFESHSFIVKPETIIINGVDIPKPLSKDDFAKYSSNHGRIYYPQPCEALYGWGYARSYVYSGKYIFYSDKKQAIEASKLLFGIKE